MANLSKENLELLKESPDFSSLFPSFAGLYQHKIVFKIDFGLPHLPEEPGLIVIRGARQFGKSTWLENQVVQTHQSFGPGSCFYLNGDSIKNEDHLIEEISYLVKLFTKSINRIFIDEITSIDRWEVAIKRLWDSGITRKTLIVTTGSNAQDLRHGTERLPGRKGRLDRTNYIFTPISFQEFARFARPKFAEKTWQAYLIAGGSPLACRELIESGRIPEFIIALVRDWIMGAVAKAQKNRALMMSIIEQLIARGGTPVSLTKLAKEAGMANNSVALSYADLLQDLLVLHRCEFSMPTKLRPVPRKESKFPFINLLALSCLHPANIRTVLDFEALPEGEQGKWMEWLVAQELWRRSAKATGDIDSKIMYWHGNNHELDFITNEGCYEVKRGKTSAEEFSWFVKSFPQTPLCVISGSRYQLANIKGFELESFLLEVP